MVLIGGKGKSESPEFRASGSFRCTFASEFKGASKGARGHYTPAVFERAAKPVSLTPAYEDQVGDQDRSVRGEGRGWAEPGFGTSYGSCSRSSYRNS